LFPLVIGLAAVVIGCGAHPVPPPPAGAQSCWGGNVKTCASECDQGNAQSCYRLAAASEVGQDGTDADRAQPLYQKACDAGYPQACARLGLAYQTGALGTQDAARAKPLLEKGCAAGVMVACGALAPAPSETVGPPPPKPLPSAKPATAK
jgi:hypothetical protein